MFGLSPWVLVGGALAIAGAYAGGRIQQKIADAQDIGASEQREKVCIANNDTFVAAMDQIAKKGQQDDLAQKQSAQAIQDLNDQLRLRDAARRTGRAPAAGCDQREQYLGQDVAAIMAGHRAGRAK